MIVRSAATVALAHGLAADNLRVEVGVFGLPGRKRTVATELGDAGFDLPDDEREVGAPLVERPHRAGRHALLPGELFVEAHEVVLPCRQLSRSHPMASATPNTPLPEVTPQLVPRE